MTYIITGPYGSGKTEFCVNFALYLSKQGKKVTIADLDTVNPYFRSREKEAELKKHGITIMGDHLDNNVGQDVPAVSYAFLSVTNRKDEVLIIDLAGGKLGVNLLAACYKHLAEHEFWCVVNTSRPDTANTQKIVDFVRGINSITQTKITGLINNGHMLHFTETEHILASQQAAIEASQVLEIPLVYTLVREDLNQELKDQLKSSNILSFNQLQLRETWQ